MWPLSCQPQCLYIFNHLCSFKSTCLRYLAREYIFPCCNTSRSAQICSHPNPGIAHTAFCVVSQVPTLLFAWCPITNLIRRRPSRPLSLFEGMLESKAFMTPFHQGILAFVYCSIKIKLHLSNCNTGKMINCKKTGTFSASWGPSTITQKTTTNQIHSFSCSYNALFLLLNLRTLWDTQRSSGEFTHRHQSALAENASRFGKTIYVFLIIQLVSIKLGLFVTLPQQSIS